MGLAYRLPGGGYCPIIATSATTSTNIAGGSANQAVVQTAPSTTGFKTYTQQKTASTIVSRDTNGNSYFANLGLDFATTVTSAGTKTLTAGSAYVQEFTGSTTHDVVLPAGDTMGAGHMFKIVNRSTGALTIKYNDGSTMVGVAHNQVVEVQLEANSSGNGVWANIAPYYVASAGSASTATVAVTVSTTVDGASATNYIPFVAANDGSSQGVKTDAGLVYNPSTNVLTTGGLNLGGDTLASYVKGTWVPVQHNLGVVGTPTYSGTYIKIGDLVYGTLMVSSTTSTASTSGSTYFSGFPFNGANTGTCQASDGNTWVSYGNGLTDTTGDILTPTWGATNLAIITFCIAL